MPSFACACRASRSRRAGCPRPSAPVAAAVPRERPRRRPARTCSGRRSVRSRSPSMTWPPLLRSSPATASTSVDFPAPLAPRSAVTCAGGISSETSIDDGTPAAVDTQPSRRRPSRTPLPCSLTRPPRCPGRRGSRARPAAPLPSARTRSACRSRGRPSSRRQSETRPMSWSTRMTSAPNCSGILWITRPCARSRPAEGRPQARRGARPAACPRPRARARRAAARAAPSPPTFALGETSRPTKSIAASTSALRVARFEAECSWIIATLSKTESFSIACSVWNVRRRPHRARRKSAIASRSSPKPRIAPSAGPDEAAEDVEERRLAGAVRPDQPARPARERRR